MFDAVQIRSRVELGFPNIERQLREEFIPGFLETFARIFKGEEAFGALATGSSGLSAVWNPASTACRIACSRKWSSVTRRNPRSRKT